MFKQLCIIALSVVALSAQELHFKSTQDKTMLIELYSSEGCSSCPSAEKWLNTFTTNPAVFKTVIPLAFHVSYWNRLGWSDVFAKSSFDNRQRDYRSMGHTSSVYTPQFVVNAQEWRGWFEGTPLSLPEQKSGILEASIDKEHVTINYQDSTKNYTLHSALLGFGLVSQVKNGENGGRTLEHDFVVLEHKSESFNKGHKVSTKLSSKVVAKRYAYVVWLSEPDTGAIIQATGGWL